MSRPPYYARPRKAAAPFERGPYGEYLLGGSGATPAPLERELQDRLIEAGRLCGWLCYHTHDSRHSPAGFPDLVMVRDGAMLALECKRSERAAQRSTSLAQLAWIDELRRVPGVRATIVTPENEELVLGWITEVRS